MTREDAQVLADLKAEARKSSVYFRTGRWGKGMTTCILSDAECKNLIERCLDHRPMRLRQPRV